MMTRAFIAIAVAILSSGVVAAQGRGAVTITPDESAAADKMKLDAETAAGLQKPPSLVTAGAPVEGAPFTAQDITETTGTLRDGTHISRITTVAYARDAEGRTRRETDSTITIMDPVANVNYTLIKKTHTAVKMEIIKVNLMINGQPLVFDAMSNADRDNLKMKLDAEIKAQKAERDSAGMLIRLDAGPQSSEEPLGAQTMEGVSAIGKRITTTFPVSPETGNDQPIKVVEEHWYSPDLQTNIVSHTDDPRSTTQHTERLTSIKRGDPDPSLFQLPPDYTVVAKKMQQ
jgi:hypothetical protein